MNLSVSKLPTKIRRFVEALPPVTLDVVKQSFSEARIPRVYAETVRSLADAKSIDDAMHGWSRADVMAAWARIHFSKAAEQAAKKLKHYARRRLGELALLLHDGDVKQARKTLTRKLRGNNCVAAGAIDIASYSEDEFTMRVERSPTSSAYQLANESPACLRRTAQQDAKRGSKDHISDGYFTAKTLSDYTRKDSVRLGRSVEPGEIIRVRKLLGDFRNWLASFEDELPETE